MQATADSQHIYWMGENYTKGGFNGLQLLFVGESTYHDPHSPEKKALPTSKNLITAVLNGEQGRWTSFYTKIYKVTTGRTHETPSKEDIKRFWESVAFVNYIPVPIASTSRVRPTNDQWESAREPFLKVLAEVNPDGIILLGKELGRKLIGTRVVERKSSKKIDVGYIQVGNRSIPTRVEIQHPSTGFKYAFWNKVVDGFMEYVREEDFE